MRSRPLLDPCYTKLMISISHTAWLALAAFLATACASPTPQPQAPPRTEPYRVGASDQLFVAILPDPAIEREVTVRPDGMISVDLAGDVRAAGLTPEEIALEVERKIVRYKRDAKATVSVRSALSSQITVLGAVQLRMTFPLERDTRVAQAIGRAGGPTYLAAPSRTRIIRNVGNQTQVYHVNLSAITRGDLSTNYLLQGGDIVVVPDSVPAVIGDGIRAIFYPLQQIFGLGANVASTVVAPY